jgi:hypothetical protein
MACPRGCRVYLELLLQHPVGGRRAISRDCVGPAVCRGQRSRDIRDVQVGGHKVVHDCVQGHRRRACWRYVLPRPCGELEHSTRKHPSTCEIQMYPCVAHVHCVSLCCICTHVAFLYLYLYFGNRLFLYVNLVNVVVPPVVSYFYDARGEMHSE